MKPFSDLPQENLTVIGGKITDKLVGFFDPMTILMIIGIAVNVIKIIYECRKKQKVMKFLLRKNGMAAKIFVKEKLYSELIKVGINEENSALACEKIKEMYSEEDWDQHLKPLYQ